MGRRWQTADALSPRTSNCPARPWNSSQLLYSLDRWKCEACIIHSITCITNPRVGLFDAMTCYVITQLWWLGNPSTHTSKNLQREPEKALLNRPWILKSGAWFFLSIQYIKCSQGVNKRIQLQSVPTMCWNDEISAGALPRLSLGSCNVLGCFGLPGIRWMEPLSDADKFSHSTVGLQH